LQPLSYAVGLGYYIPRLGGSRVRLRAQANGVVNRETGQFEGSYGSLVVAQPLFSALTEWSWDGQIAWRSDVTRRYVNAELSVFDARATPENDRIPFEYQSHIATSEYSVTRSFGWENKNDFSLGAAAEKRVYRTDDLSAFDPRAAAEFVRLNVPVSDTRVGPFFQYHGYTSRFARVLNLETLGLQEDYRLGYELYLRVYPIFRALGSSRDILGVLASAQYTTAVKDGLFRMSVESLTEPEPDRLADGYLGTYLRLASPSLGVGRLVYDLRLLYRYRDYLNRTSFLGGDTRLRGYPTSFFVGKDVLVSNFEFRSRPVQILTVQWGLAAFYDAGDAFYGFSDLSPKQGAGVGLRVLFPQLDRIALRADVGFPLGDGAHLAGVAPVSVFVKMGQAFDMPALTSAVLPSGPTWQE
jgi:hypothetical protein